MRWGSEWSSLQLDANLVTPSACKTGLGKVLNGDDVVGLARSFLYAGSRAYPHSFFSAPFQLTGLAD